MIVVVQPAQQELSFLQTPPQVDPAAPALDVSVAAAEIRLEPAAPPGVELGTQIIRDTGEIPVYRGATEITPAREAQILATYGCIVPENIRVNPIPQNYGLIVWNGATLTVS